MNTKFYCQKERHLIAWVIPFFLLCSLWLFLNNSVFAELSDHQTIKSIEQLARPAGRKVFYKWLPDKFRKALIEAGEWSPELYEYYMKKSRGHFAGSGFYVSEHISAGYIPDSGNTLVQVEVKDCNCLDLSQMEVQNALKEENIDIQRLLNSELNPQIAIKYSSVGYDKWVLKGRRGMKFKPFSSEDISLHTLEESYRELPWDRRSFFEASIREDILNREQRDPTVLGGPFVKIIEEALGRVYVSTAIDAAINSVDFRLETMGDAVGWLINVKRYLSDQSLEKLARETKDLPINDMNEAVNFLILANKYLSGAEIRRIVLRTPTKSASEADRLRSWIPSSTPCYDHWIIPR